MFNVALLTICLLPALVSSQGQGGDGLGDLGLGNLGLGGDLGNLGGSGGGGGGGGKLALGVESGR